MPKSNDCPNCCGRSFSQVDPDAYYECPLCERPTVEFHAWYKAKWPTIYGRVEARRWLVLGGVG